MCAHSVQPRHSYDARFLLERKQAAAAGLDARNKKGAVEKRLGAEKEAARKAAYKLKGDERERHDARQESRACGGAGGMCAAREDSLPRLRFCSGPRLPSSMYSGGASRASSGTRHMTSFSSSSSPSYVIESSSSLRDSISDSTSSL